MVFVSKGRMTKRNAMQGLTVLGVDLQDAREEIFVRLICDGISIGVAFARAGFTSKHQNAAHNLFNLPRVQERAGKILEARRTQGVVTLPQVTDMLQRVFAGAHMEGEYSAAHNAAFSLARLYGHVTDKSVIEHIRRPSRDPDAPSETALEAWAASLPVISPPSETAQIASQKAAIQGPPAPLLGPGPSPPSREPGCYPDATPSQGPSDKPQQYQALSTDAHVLAQHVGEENKVDWLGPGPGRSGIENGAPVGPVTGTPYTRGGSELLGSPSVVAGTGTKMGETSSVRRVPDSQVSETELLIPTFEQLFGDGGERADEGFWRSLRQKAKPAPDGGDR